jgi:hypothetical protein
MLFANEPGANIPGAPIVNDATIMDEAAEVAVKLSAFGGMGAKRAAHSDFALLSEKTLREFLEHG